MIFENACLFKSTGREKYINHKASHRKTFLIRFAYFGQKFHGVEPQRTVPTVGGALHAILEQCAGIPPKALQFTARTDAGVHAFENAATCWFPSALDENAFLKKLEAAEKPEGLIRIEATLVPFNVHARNYSKAKHYRYVVEDSFDSEISAKNPFAWQIVPKLDAENMRKAASTLIGEHDFSSFRASGCTAGTTIKHIYAIEIHGPYASQGGGRQFHIDFLGNAFLRKMVRNLAAFLVEVGSGLRHPSDAKRVLDAKSRQAAGLTAPAHGLTLMRLLQDLS